MTIESAVADLTTATTNLLSSVNVQKSTLDASVATATTKAGEAAASATTANTKAGEASGSAASALAIYGSTAAVNTAVANAQAQASLAAGYAASAGSAIQQDISGVTAAALHRSPNAVVAMFVYDTTKDSDPSWTEKCQHTSWYNESLNGKWLGACVSATSVAACETIARAISGATTGDYFQASYDGKFYKLNAGSGTTEVFRGNKAKFPKIVGIVAEAASINIYDLTEPGRPMWMRISDNGNASLISCNGAICVSMMQGTLVHGGANGWDLHITSFLKDNSWRLYGSGSSSGYYRGNIAQRYSLNGFTTDSTLPYGNYGRNINAIAMTVLPDAPVDPVSGLQVPTIAVGTSGGVSVIKHDGTVVNKTILSRAASGVSFTSDGKLGAMFYSGSGYSWYLFPDLTATSAETSVMHNNLGWSGLNDLDGAPIIGPVGSVDMVFGAGSVPRINKIKGRGTRSSLNSLNATITNLFNTGYQVGDIRRAYLADSVVESLTATEMETNGTFTTDTSGWTPDGPAVLSVDAGRLKVLGGYGYKSYTTVVGKSYIFTADLTRFNDGGLYIGTSKGSPDIYSSGRITSSQRLSVPFVAKSTQTFVALYAWDSGTEYCFYDNVSFKPCVIDRSYNARGADIFGSLTKSLSSPSASNQLVAYSGFSAANYLQEPYSADLDFGTGEWSVSAWVNIPVTLPVLNFPVTGADVCSGTWLNAYSNAFDSFSSSSSDAFTGSTTGAKAVRTIVPCAFVVGKTYRVELTMTLANATFSSLNSSNSLYSGINTIIDTPGYGAGPTNGKVHAYITAASAYLMMTFIMGAGGSVAVSGLHVYESSIAPMSDRSYSSGPSIKFGVNALGYLQATAYDGTTTRTVTTSAAYNTNTMIKARAVYRTDGSLSIMVNGVQVAVTYGNPLLTLNNSNAVLTIGNSYALDAPFPGSIALLKLSATAPTPDQALWMYEQEKHLFRDGANCLLPDSGNIVDLTYDEATDKWIAVSAANESDWTGLVRTNVIAVPAGSNIKASAGSGIKLNARSTTSPGVDVTIPAWNLREELVKRAEAAAKKAQPVVIFDYSGGFTATTVNGNTAITSVASLTYPAQGSLIGATVTGTGIPASTVIVAISGTTIYLSKACTASNSAVQIALSDFILPVGYETRAVLAAGAVKQEGSTKDWTRTFDGFREKVTFGTAPGYSAFVEIQAVRSI